MNIKKFFLVIIIGLAVASSFLFSVANAQGIIINTCDESKEGGLVPCGRKIDKDGFLVCPCQIDHILILVRNIFNFIVYYISIPLAGLLIIIGGTILIISAGNPGLAALGKRILWGAIIGILLIWCAWLIIYTLLLIMGVKI